MAGLLEELNKQRKIIKTDSYSMSIGEIINLYNDGDLKLDPAFQRLFRWSDAQKTKFIESILLGIPIPEIFVAQDKEGKWTIVDGVQRISTILQLTGGLPDKAPLNMTSEKYLTSLGGLTWETLPEEVQRLFKRAKLGINIILTENSIQAQYELFQRLNTGGLHLEPQELRNCLIIMLNEDLYNNINELKNYPAYKNTLNLSEKKYDEEYHMELILRYFIAVYKADTYTDYSLSNIHMSDFIDKETISLIEDNNFNLDEAIVKFKQTFDWLDEVMGKDSFKKYDSENTRFTGQFLNASFEAITTGLSINFDEIKDKKEDTAAKIKALYDEEVYNENVRHGVRSPVRFKNLVEFSKVYFLDAA